MVGRGEIPVDMEEDLDHRKGGAGKHRRLVEPEFTPGSRPVADQFALEHQMVDESEAASRDLLQNFVDLVTREIGQEPEMTEVDPHHRHLPIAHPACRPEDRAIPTEDDHEIDPCSIGGGRRVEAPFPPIPLRGLAVDHRMAMVVERCRDAFGNLGDPGDSGRSDHRHAEPFGGR